MKNEKRETVCPKSQFEDKIVIGQLNKKSFDETISFCDKAFNDSSTLRNHREGVHLKNVKYNCDQCDYFAYCQNRLGKHKRLKHKIFLTRI